MGRQVIKVNRAQCRRCNTVLESLDETSHVTCPCKNLVVGGGLSDLYRNARYVSDVVEMAEWEYDPTPTQDEEVME